MIILCNIGTAELLSLVEHYFFFYSLFSKKLQQTNTALYIEKGFQIRYGQMNV